MSSYTIEDIDELTLQNYRSLVFHCAQLQAEQRRMRVIDFAFAVRVGMSESEDYQKVMDTLAQREPTRAPEQLTLADKLFTDSYVHSGLQKASTLQAHLAQPPPV